MHYALALALLAATAPPKKLAAPGLHGLDVPAEALVFYNEHLSLQLQQRGFEVLTAKHLETVLGLERQKELLGCSDQSCLAEIASALGTDAVVIGEVGGFGDDVQLDLKVLAAGEARVLATFSRRVPKAKAVEALDEAALSLATALGMSAAQPSVVPSLVAGVAGAVSLGIGVGLLVQSRSQWNALHDATRSLSDEQAADVARAGSRDQTWGWVAVGIGGALAVTAILLRVLQLGPTPVSGAAVVTSSGGAATLVVELP